MQRQATFSSYEPRVWVVEEAVIRAPPPGEQSSINLETRTAPSAVIELRVERLALLFDPLDPFPIPSRDLSKRAEEFIIEWAQGLPPDAPIRIIVHAPEADTQKAEAGFVDDAVQAHFASNAAVVSSELRELFRTGRISLLIGLLVLSVCILGASLITTSFSDTPFTQFFSEGLIILGWVANWRPLEIFLYDWWPLSRRLKLQRRLASASVEIRSMGANAPMGPATG